jgi:hypothetical protein
VGGEVERLAPGALARHGAILVVVGALFVPVEAVAVLAGARLTPHRRVTGVAIVLAAAAAAAVRLVFLRTGGPPDSASEAYRDGYSIGVLFYWATGLVLMAMLAWHYSRIEVTGDPPGGTQQQEAPAVWRRVAAWLTDLCVAFVLGIGAALLAGALGASDGVVGVVFLAAVVTGLAAIALLGRAGVFDPTPGKRLVGVRVERDAPHRAVVRAPNYGARALLSGAGAVFPVAVLLSLAVTAIHGSSRDPAADAAAEYRRGMIAGCRSNGWSEEQCTCLADRVIREGLMEEVQTTLLQLQRDPNAPVSQQVRAAFAGCLGQQ